MAFTVRNYTDSDFYPWVDFYSRIFNKKSIGKELFSEYLIQKFRRPGYDAQKNFIIAEEDGKIIGFGDVIYEAQIHRAVLSGYVLDGFRRRGVGSALFRSLLVRCQEFGAVSLHANIRESTPGARLFLYKCGFFTVRYFFDMQMDLENRPLEEGGVDDADLGNFKRGEEDSLACLQNKIFKGSWGFCPNSAEDIRYYLDLTGVRIEEVLCLRKNDRTIGYSWFHRLPLKDDARAMRIHMFGVDPEYRGKGWGRKILLASLSRMQRRGIRTVELTVDSENAPGVSLYESLGFSRRSKSRWCEKRL